MNDQVMVAVDVPMAGDDRHKNWARVVESVDVTKSSGWAFEGPFIAAGGIQDVPAGSIILVYGERGSRANPQSQARVYVANSDATLTLEGDAKGQAWARTLRDVVERLLGVERPTVDLSGVDEVHLVNELESRGWKVTRE